MIGLAVVVLAWLAPPMAASIDAQTAPPATGDLQTLIDAAAPGERVTVPPGLYREMVTVRRPIVLDGAGAEIRGSDVWTDWSVVDGVWRSGDAIPPLETGGVCRAERCAWPEQVFSDGTPLLQVRSSPLSGQFAIDGERRVVLADDPNSRLVEVTTRPHWMVIEAPDVTIEGFTMRHAASPAQFGGLHGSAQADRLTVRDVTLSDAHGALAGFHGMTGASLLDSDLRRGGQLGIQGGGTGTTDLLISGNRVADNNTEGFDPGWESGGMKLALATGLRVIDNVVTGNDGPGIWCDIDCRDVVYSGNRVASNTGAGLFFEISDGARIFDNEVTENGWGYPTWGWGAGILISSSTDAEVFDNVLTWNADGISVISQIRDRPSGDAVVGTSVHDNTVMLDAAGGFGLAWLQDWPGPMFEPASGNAGLDNGFWIDPAATERCHFEWDGCRQDLAAFAATPGGQQTTLLTDVERDTLLGINAIPPAAHPSDEPPRRRDVVLVIGIVGLVTLGTIAALIALWRRRRRIPVG